MARAAGTVYEAFDRFSRPDLLILDDFFTTPIEDRRNTVGLFETIESRKGHSLTLVASELEPDQWYPKSNSDLRTDSMLNRAVEHARVLDIKGRTYASTPRGRRRSTRRGVGPVGTA